MFLLLLMFQMTLVVIQLLDSILLLPPILATHHVIWLFAVALPLLSITLVGNPFDPNIMEMALGKNKDHLTQNVRVIGQPIIFYLGSSCDKKLIFCLCLIEDC